MVISFGTGREIQSSGAKTLYAVFTYNSNGCAASFKVDGPCGFTQDSGPGTPGCIGTPCAGGAPGGKAEMTVIARDPGNYTFSVSSHPYCGAFQNEYYESISVTVDGVTTQSIGHYNASVTVTVNVNCDPQDLQPQTLSDNNFEFLSEGENFSWIDAQGIPRTVTVHGCDFDPPDEPNAVDVGKTFVFPSIPPNGLPNVPPYYKPVSDRVIKACRTTIDGNLVWKFSVDNIRIPIFESTCPRLGLIDIGDGTNSNNELNVINNCTAYAQVMSKLEFFINGTHNPNNVDPGFNIYSLPAVVLHEQQHRKDYVELMKRKFNKLGFPALKTLQVSVSEAICANDAINQKTPLIDRLLEGTYVNTVDDIIDNTNADRAAKPFFETIRDRIKAWAINQPWWDEHKEGCKGTE